MLSCPGQFIFNGSISIITAFTLSSISALMAGLRSVLFTSLWIFSLAGEDTKIITAKSGQDVPLHCQGPRDADIPGILWSRPDLGSEKYVFFFRGNRPYENYQLPSYHGRVNLTNPEMKDGDVSVVLKNVSVNDTGTYQCRVIIRGGEEPKLYSTIQLNVSVSGHTVGHTGRGQDTGGNLWVVGCCWACWFCWLYDI
ncbi:butyrophilin subfamily 2 member A2-like isoform X1 [Perca fluviatilis]|uniref:butyrophilin subfamily 2 member A2-like isoform X1 n=1 Tax=Perca fluviatilis TaxID=8168 RepID=UPI00196495B9|nr:butyrophilin subfamily 2 member A2-like isoform X1 [Perca fluviatilis]